MKRAIPSRLPSASLLAAVARASAPSSALPPPRPSPAASSSSSSRPSSAARRAFGTSRPLRSSDSPRSPFSVFVETLKAEVEKDKALQGNVKQLQGDVEELQDSEAMKRAKDMYERARITNILKNNPKLQEAADDMKRSGVRVSEAVAEALRQVEESEFARALAAARERVASGVAAATAPVRNTAAYKALAESVSEVFDESASLRYGGYAHKEQRRRRRQLRLEKLGRMGMGVGSRVKANEEAGSALVATSQPVDDAPPSSWQTFKATSPLFQKLNSLKERYDETEDPLVSRVRAVTSWFGRFGEETETAQVTRAMLALDPSFDVEGFARELREYILPEILDAYLSGDRETLKGWCNEASYSLLCATLDQYAKNGIVSESRVVDIANVDVAAGSMKQEYPAWIVSFTTQEIFLFKNAKTGEVFAGSPDSVVGVRYAVAITRNEETLDDEITGGWQMTEVVRRGDGL